MSPRIFGLVVVMVVSVVAVTGVLISVFQVSPEALDSESWQQATGQTVAVEEQEFFDIHHVELDVATSEPFEVISLVSGRVTADFCSTGASIESGQAIARVNGTTLLALYTTVPLWRDLAVGTKGDDVRSLQEELRRLGASLRVDGVFRSETLQAYKALSDAAGITADVSVVAFDRTVYLPSPSISVDECLVTVGDFIQSGQVLARTATDIVGVKVRALPDGAIDGARSLTVDDITVHIDETGVVNDSEALVALSRADSIDALLADPELPSPVGVFILSDPVTVVAVPPASIQDASSDSPCVTTAQGPVAVRIVGSTLGRTLVAVEGASDPPDEIYERPVDGQPCA